MSYQAMKEILQDADKQATGTKSVIDKVVIHKAVLNEKPIKEFIERMRARGFNVETDGVDVMITGDNLEAYYNEFETLAKLISATPASADLNELTESRYYVDARNAVPQPLYSDPEECKKACEVLRAAGYNAVTNGNIILVQPKAKEGQA